MIKSHEIKNVTDFNVADSVRREIKVLVTKTRYTVYPGKRNGSHSKYFAKHTINLLVHLAECHDNYWCIKAELCIIMCKLTVMYNCILPISNLLMIIELVGSCQIFNCMSSDPSGLGLGTRLVHSNAYTCMCVYVYNNNHCVYGQTVCIAFICVHVSTGACVHEFYTCMYTYIRGWMNMNFIKLILNNGYLSKWSIFIKW